MDIFSSMEISYIERKTGQMHVEKVYGHKTLSLLYGDRFWSRVFSAIFLPLIARFSLFSILYGFFQKLPSSCKKIEPFIKTYGIDASEFVEANFSSFNDFFIRKLKKECRPIAKGAEILVTPADGRYLVYPNFQQFTVKGRDFSLSDFLQDPVYARRFSDGSMVIIRLCPTDYHRYHFPCDGVPSKPKLINGPLYSVNPMALRKNISILSENKRVVTEMDTELFGTFLYVEIGATAVGSIHQTFTPDSEVKKGDEKGYFEFGGSCIVLLFEKGGVRFDEDLRRNSEKGIETRINFGQSLAHSLRGS